MFGAGPNVQMRIHSDKNIMFPKSEQHLNVQLAALMEKEAQGPMKLHQNKLSPYKFLDTNSNFEFNTVVKYNQNKLSPYKFLDTNSNFEFNTVVKYNQNKPSPYKFLDTNLNFEFNTVFKYNQKNCLHTNFKIQILRYGSACIR